MKTALIACVKDGIDLKDIQNYLKNDKFEYLDVLKVIIVHIDSDKEAEKIKEFQSCGLFDHVEKDRKVSTSDLSLK